jgi:hypothetical protein
VIPVDTAVGGAALLAVVLLPSGTAYAQPVGNANLLRYHAEVSGTVTVHADVSTWNLTIRRQRGQQAPLLAASGIHHHPVGDQLYRVQQAELHRGHSRPAAFMARYVSATREANTSIGASTTSTP